MKKIAFYAVLLICISLLSSALFYWIKWQTKLQPRVIKCEINNSTFKIAEPISIETTFNIPLHCDFELQEFTLPNALKEHNSGIIFKHPTPNTLLMIESFFGCQKGVYKDLNRELIIHTPRGTESIKFSYPEFKVQSRNLSDDTQTKIYGEIKLSKSVPTLISLELTIAIITISSLIICIAFFKSLPGKLPGPLQIFRQELQQLSDYQESPDSQPLMRLQDQIRNALAYLVDESFRSSPLKELPWEKVSQNDAELIRPLLQKIHTSRFTGEKITKIEFHEYIQSLIQWADKMILEENK